MCVCVFDREKVCVFDREKVCVREREGVSSEVEKRCSCSLSLSTHAQTHTLSLTFLSLVSSSHVLGLQSLSGRSFEQSLLNCPEKTTTRTFPRRLKFFSPTCCIQSTISCCFKEESGSFLPLFQFYFNFSNFFGTKVWTSTEISTVRTNLAFLILFFNLIFSAKHKKLQYFCLFVLSKVCDKLPGLRFTKF